jgi:hypothetical protein
MSVPASAGLRAALNSARSIAARRGELDFDLSLRVLEELWHRQGGRCAVSGLEFDDERFADAFVKRPFAASVDRIDSSRGHVSENVRLVCVAVNFARGQWGDDVLRQVAYGIVETERDQENAWYHAKRAALAEARRRLEELDGPAYDRQKRRIAGLKAALTKGPSRLRRAGRRAGKTLREPGSE